MTNSTGPLGALMKSGSSALNCFANAFCRGDSALARSRRMTASDAASPAAASSAEIRRTSSNVSP
jgi:hypothetical protein